MKEDIAEKLRAEANVTLLQTETGPQGIFESFVLKSPLCTSNRQYFPSQPLRWDGAATHEFQSEVSALENSAHAAHKKTGCISSFQLVETKMLLFYFVFNLY